MARLTVQNDHLTLSLTKTEKILGLTGDLSVPLASVSGIAVTSDPFEAAPGIRAPGFAVPGRIRIGTWRGRAGRTLVLARRNQPALVVTLRNGPYAALVIGDNDAAGTARAVSASAPALSFIESETDFASGQERLFGTHTTPGSGKAWAQALLLPGSGEVNRDADHRRIPLGVSRHLAHALAARGVASLRYDKRGVGRSPGSYLEAGLADNRADAEAALEWLRSAAPGAPVFLIGHSEGAILAELLAAGRGGLAGVVLLAAPATTGEQTMAWQTRQIAGALPPVARAVVRALRIDLTQQQRKSVARIRATTTDTARLQGRRVNARWQRELLDFDPAALLPRITAPVLAITGGKDLQVNPGDLEVIAREVSGPVEIRRPADLTHLLRTDPGPANLGAYRRLSRQPTDPQLLRTVTDWIAAFAGVTR